jgi:hypothetical protein
MKPIQLSHTYIEEVRDEENGIFVIFHFSIGIGYFARC